MTCEPKMRFTVEVTATAIPLGSIIEVWLCANSYDRIGKRFGCTYSPVVLRNVEDRLIVRCRVSIILILDVKMVHRKKPFDVHPSYFVRLKRRTT